LHIELTGDITEIPCQCQLVRNQGQQFVTKGSPQASLAAVGDFTAKSYRLGHDKGKEWKDKERHKTIEGTSHGYLPRTTVFLSATWYAFPSLPVHQTQSRSYPFIFTHSPFLCLPRVLATFYFVTWQYLCACVKSINALYEVNCAVEESRREFYIGCRKLENRFSSVNFLIVLVLSLL